MDKTEKETDDCVNSKEFQQNTKKNNNFQNYRIREERFLYILFYSGLPPNQFNKNSKFQSHGTGLYLFSTVKNKWSVMRNLNIFRY